MRESSFKEWADQPYRLYGSRVEWLMSFMPASAARLLMVELEIAFDAGCLIGYDEGVQEEMDQWGI
jgi:hypothetical protein